MRKHVIFSNTIAVGAIDASRCYTGEVRHSHFEYLFRTRNKEIYVLGSLL